MSYMRSGPGLVQLQRSNYGWELTMEGYTEPAAVGGYLWPGGIPAGVNIVLSVAVTEPIQLGTFMLTGLNMQGGPDDGAVDRKLVRAGRVVSR